MLPIYVSFSMDFPFFLRSEMRLFVHDCITHSCVIRYVFSLCVERGNFNEN